MDFVLRILWALPLPFEEGEGNRKLILRENLSQPVNT
jgi:hypothetical protein